MRCRTSLRQSWKFCRRSLTASSPGLLEGLPRIVQAGIDLLVALVQDLPEIIQTIVAALPQIVSAVVDALLASIPQLVETGVTLFISLIENLPTIILEIVKAVPQIIEGIVNAFTESIPQIVEVGANLVRGLWEGIQSLASWLWDKVSGWISSIWDGICDFFGIASPSKEMGWVGEMLVEGLAGSLDKNGKTAVRSAEHLADGISSVMQGMTADMQTAIPSHINMDTTLSGLSDVGGRPAGRRSTSPFRSPSMARRWPGFWRKFSGRRMPPMCVISEPCKEKWP